MDTLDEKIAPPAIYAWVGEDELGSGEIGLKQGFTPMGIIALVSIKIDRMTRMEVNEQMRRQAEKFGKTIRLVRYVPVEVVATHGGGH